MQRKGLSNRLAIPRHSILTVSSVLTVNFISGTSLVVQWLRCHASNAEDPGLILGQGTRSHMLQLRVHMQQLKHAAAKTWSSQVNE